MKKPIIITVTALILAACGGSGEDRAAKSASIATEHRNDSEPTASPPAALANTAVPASASTGSDLSTETKDFQSFWVRFRQAALTGDAATLSALSAPVVLGRGILDDDPVKKLRPAQVPAAIAKVMADSTPVDSANHTQRALFETTKNVTVSELDGPDHHRMGNVEFQSGRTGWRLAELYLGDD